MFYGPERSLLVCWCMSQARLDNTCILLLLDEVDPVVVSFPKSLFREVMAPWICLAFSPKMGAAVCPASSLLLGIQEEFFIFFSVCSTCYCCGDGVKISMILTCRTRNLFSTLFRCWDAVLTADTKLPCQK